MIHEIPVTWNVAEPPMPNGRQAIQGKLYQLREMLKAKKSGESFPWPDNHDPYRAAIQVGVKITTRKQNGGYIVWKR